MIPKHDDVWFPKNDDGFRRILKISVPDKMASNIMTRNPKI